MYELPVFDLVLLGGRDSPRFELLGDERSRERNGEIHQCLAGAETQCVFLWLFRGLIFDAPASKACVPRIVVRCFNILRLNSLPYEIKGAVYPKPL